MIVNDPLSSRRIIVIDDNAAIHDDFRKTFCENRSDDLDNAERALFGSAKTSTPALRFNLTSARQGQEGLQRVREALAEGKPFQVAFVDMRMPPGWDGLQTIEKLWEVDPQLQVVICTAYSDYSLKQIVGQLGVNDRLLILKKPFDPVEVYQMATTLTEKWHLSHRAKLKLAELEAIVERRTADLKSAALHDKLTGLPNRELFIDRLAQTIAARKRDPQRHYAVLFLDFDQFKLINDSLGHEAGDQLLWMIAARLQTVVRSSDSVSRRAGHTAARLGGDEFIVLLDSLADPRDAAMVASRLLNELARPYEVRGQVIQSTVSIGITTSAGEYTSADEAIRDADTAMYHAKTSGKAQFAIFDQKMHDSAVTRLSLQRDLREALEIGQLHLAYQPIVSLTTGRPKGFEALVRWNHPTRGPISPAVFIEIAEETDLIHPLGEWVLREATRQWTAVAEDPRFSHVTVSVNLSRRQLATRNLPQLVDSALQASGLPIRSLRLEITESAIIADMNSAIRTLEAIRDMGIRLDIDDFGIGYSSMSCLHKFPISGLKIDRSFITDLSERRAHAAVIHAIVTLAQNLEIELVAEGIETEDQAQQLRSMGVPNAQGYLFARPMPLAQALQMLQTSYAVAA